MSFSFDNDTEYSQPLTNDIYMKGFLSNLYLRASCYSCHFKSLNRPSDITLADFWGIENVLPHLDDDKGTSLVLVHTEKGAAMLATLADKMICEKVDVNKAISFNSSVIKSVAMNSKREEFFTELTRVKMFLVLSKNMLILVHYSGYFVNSDNICLLGQKFIITMVRK